VAITDPALIAASFRWHAGQQWKRGGDVRPQTVRTLSVAKVPTDYYSGIVFNVGNNASNASAEQSASALVLQQLNDQLASISGVSLDEEAANMVQLPGRLFRVGRGHHDDQ